MAGDYDDGQIIPSGGSAVQIEVARAIQEAQAAIVVAKRFPRDEAQAEADIKKACQDKRLAADAEYLYPRGKNEISGPSIRLAETVATNWGNLDFGLRELEQRPGARPSDPTESVIEAYCHDLQRNVRRRTLFLVKHERKARGSTYHLTEARDISEITLNQGQRKVRGAILAVIPRHVIDTAMEVCTATLAATAKGKSPEERASDLIKAYSKVNVTEQQLQAKIGKPLVLMTEAEWVRLVKIYNSIRDEMTKPSDWFHGAMDFSPQQKSEAKTKAERLAEELRSRSQSPEIQPPGDAAEALDEYDHVQGSEPQRDEPPEAESEHQESQPDPMDTTSTNLASKLKKLEQQYESVGGKEWRKEVLSWLGSEGYESVDLVPPEKRSALLKHLADVIAEIAEVET